MQNAMRLQTALLQMISNQLEMVPVVLETKIIVRDNLTQKEMEITLPPSRMRAMDLIGDPRMVHLDPQSLEDHMRSLNIIILQVINQNIKHQKNQSLQRSKRPITWLKEDASDVVIRDTFCLDVH